MSVRAYNRGSRAIRETIDRELAERRVVRREAPAPRFWATVEYLDDTSAILTLVDTDGNWSGSGVVSCKAGRAAVYEECYKHACCKVADKGGRLERFHVDEMRADVLAAHRRG